MRRRLTRKAAALRQIHALRTDHESFHLRTHPMRLILGPSFVLGAVPEEARRTGLGNMGDFMGERCAKIWRVVAEDNFNFAAEQAATDRRQARGLTWRAGFAVDGPNGAGRPSALSVTTSVEQCQRFRDTRIIQAVYEKGSARGSRKRCDADGLRTKLK